MSARSKRSKAKQKSKPGKKAHVKKVKAVKAKKSAKKFQKKVVQTKAPESIPVENPATATSIEPQTAPTAEMSNDRNEAGFSEDVPHDEPFEDLDDNDDEDSEGYF